MNLQYAAYVSNIVDDQEVGFEHLLYERMAAWTNGEYTYIFFQGLAENTLLLLEMVID